MKKLRLIFMSLFTFGVMSLYASSYHPSTEIIINVENATDYFQDKKFTISPNPAKNKLNITLPSALKNMTLEVFDVLGKRIHKSTITQLEASVDVSRWKNGVYLVKISNDKESQTKRFIKQ